MKTTQLSFLMLLSLLSACGGGGGGGSAGSTTVESSNNTSPASADTTTIDGENIELTAENDGFLSTENQGDKLQALAAPSSHQFVPASTQMITINSTNSSPCHLNIYSHYDSDDNNNFVPDSTSKVIQASTSDCQYSGKLYAMNHWSALLIEVIDSQLTGKPTYYEITLHSGPINISIN